MRKNRKLEEPWLAHGGLQAFCSLLSIYHPCQLLQWWPWWWNAVGSGWVFFCYSFLEEREGVIEKRELSIQKKLKTYSKKVNSFN